MELKQLVYSPPVVFFLTVAVITIFSLILSRLSAKAVTPEHSLESYACGQKGFAEYVNPDYTQFFTFAFIFTVMHVLTMVAATAPREISAMPILYLLAGVYIIVIVLRR